MRKVEADMLIVVTINYSFIQIFYVIHIIYTVSNIHNKYFTSGVWVYFRVR